MASNHEVAAIFREIADLLEVKGEVVYKYGAYREAARQIEAYATPVTTLAAERRLREIPRVGEAIAAKIAEYIKTGRMEYLDRVRSEVPPGLVDLLHVPGLGAKKIQALHRAIGITSLADLEEALRAGRVRDLPGMGEKTESNLLDEIGRLRARVQRHPIGIARPEAEEVVDALKASCPTVHAIDIAGSLRRWRDTIGDIDIIVASATPIDVLAAFVVLPMVRDVLAHGDTKASILTFRDLQIDLRVVAPVEFGAAILYFTGSKAHNVRLRALAQRRGWTLNEYALTEEATGRVIASESEEAIYHALDLAWIPPELREDLGEFELAASGDVPRLIEASDIDGELHCHTDWSDGHLTLDATVAEAERRGLRYLAITDHSQSLAMVRGLTPERARLQWAAIDAVNRRGGPTRILKGVELEILPNGSLDFPDDVLRGFDLVIASIHSGFRQDRETMTKRIVGALRNPHVDVIGHPTGRRVGRRDPYEVDMNAVLRAAAETGTAVEINANPERLDMDDAHARAAAALGVTIPINTDAHGADNFDLLRYGVATGRRAGLRPENVLNTRGLDELLSWLARPTTPA
ncbi:MAG: DNA polymerase/3'-5' exonuclease PolX [Chloroflexota bacterium]|nr:MAG: DNA polymerase/3'-5' exonuclease PolX [Chloroflexota bacterium]